MSYQVLARKWRPRSFDTLVGQEHVVKALTHALNGGRLHHAYLFTGTRGVGKTTIARILAKALNCDTGVSATPCGQCAACQEIDGGRFVDLLEVDAATNTKVDEMRQLLENASYAPTRGRYKVYVIDEVHMLSNAAFNAMLKTLEEPPEHVKFILATTDPQKIPVTVLSRCLQFNLKQMPQSSLIGHLTHVLTAENVPHEAGAVELIAKAAAGSMRDALSLLDQAIAHGAGALVADDVRRMLGVTDAALPAQILDALLANDPAALLAVVDALEASGGAADGVLADLAELIVEIQLAQVARGLDRQSRFAAAAARFAAALPASYVQLAYEILQQGRKNLAWAPDAPTGLLMVLLRLLAFAPVGQGLPSPEAVPAVAGAEKKSPLSSLPPVEAVLPTARSASDEFVALAPTAVAPDPPQVSPPAKTVDAPAQPASPPSLSRERPSVRVSEQKDDEPPPLDEVPPWLDMPDEAPVAPSPATEDAGWHGMVRALGLSGMARELAQHCELIHRRDNLFHLRLDVVHRHLRGRAVEQKLEAALQARFGPAARVQIDVGEAVGETPAARDQAERSERMAQAIAAIEADGFVREVIELLDGSIDSIAPV